MSFLLGDAYASCASASGSESEGETREERRSGEEEEEEGERNGDAEESERLPSADDVLATAAASDASFRAPRAMRKSKEMVVETFDYLTKKEQQVAGEEEEKKREEQRNVTGGTKRALTRDKRTGAPPKREKKDAKERVRAQRERGQAGIGSDFRAWKSETEMTMRQQYD